MDAGHGRRTVPNRRRLLLVGLVLVVVLICAGGGYVVTAALPVTNAVVEESMPSSTGAPTLAWPSYGAGAIAALDIDGPEEGGLLARYGSREAIPTGSIAKVVTALLILAVKPIPAGSDGEMITFTDADVGYYLAARAGGESVAPVTVGLRLTQRQALTAMMLPSANNYAKSLALWSYGSEEAFLVAARTWLTNHGFTRTVLADTSGLSPATVSTTAEIVRLGKLLLANPVLAPIVALPSAVLPTIGKLENTNSLLGRLGIDGIKSGTTDSAGSCLLFSLTTTVEGRPTTIVGVVTGASARAQLMADILTLIPSVEAGFHTVQLTTVGQRYGSYTSVWGQSVAAETMEARSLVAWGAVSRTTTVTLDAVRTVTDGQRVGTVTVSVNGAAYELPLVTDGALEEPGVGWRITHLAALGG
ncbi:D-alanyl-D-alanine carboxypeptidase family protein [Rathayibacter toxicus]|uniref:D-alanyl-D-alanine carboxypeptidase n=1 Tax=Rathayibacter toxicus TaxID=145458 RepID=A0A0U1PSS1_9MICO|nr:D-alanyl-D-alanine carboxypeptidase [Rathayibacter toxicus]ALS58148.1 hypothetical protein APU90_10535 [Rathayibacter toxicus]KKM45355.1 hypothetical protein VT73_06920 [Rathayibacter toxicus]PPG21817.1 D-alanyl-D-alanine carboxypeptidase [Rathayibacter toxicus]PPG46779.1 D-alanyl-D-alanine carboxypeptidase [Rathayibacter toxicus]PPH23850.1 D-alanyl-D-alanine carboxypeptidase [Rathayibacter toxicus]